LFVIVSFVRRWSFHLFMIVISIFEDFLL